ncbi:fibronectin type III domain-containing protein [Metabacillus arenae]|uniref:Fibronectin type III domain-containing protein n=1 Tax=Metabacillus arenae TaxID=2771434 RepID=A0A926N9J3_9BACI|nr:fibronectin type III domain-containing protein [Metabacillus arenae]MBD1379244.1 fibronectin type III domain-containing protein [Metabacillus arenae]
MATSIIQFDNGTKLSLVIRDNNQIVNLTNTSVEVLISHKGTGSIKHAEITDATKGMCEVTLYSEDVQYEGVYNFQATVIFADGKRFSSDIQRFTVSKKLDSVNSPPPGNGNGHTSVSPSTTNGNILVNGLELKVYNDQDIRDQINTINNLEIIQRLGINESGNLTIDGIEQTGVELEELNEEINLIKQSDIFTRLGVSSNGLLTIDGIEQSASGGGEEMTLIIKDYFDGNTNITKTYTEDMVGFDIINDHTTTGLTFTINNITIPVGASESYTANFAPYRSLSINTTVPYRATVRAPLRGIAPDTTAPNNVTGFTVTNITTSSLTISWNASTSTDTTEYEIYQGSTLLNSVTETDYNVTGLTASTSYTFTVKAKDGSGNIATGTSVTVSTSAPDLISPNEVTNLTASNITATSLTLSWTASSSSDVSAYEVYRGSTFLSTVTGTTYNVSGLTASTQYTFTVKAKDTSNNVSTGVSVNATTTNVVDTTAPNNVTNLVASNITQTGVTLTWAASTSTDVANYQIYNGTTNIGQASGTEFIISGLTAGTQYTFIVKAKDTSSNESSGTTVTATTSSESTTVTSVELDKISSTLEQDQSIQLTATVLPSNAPNKDVTWSSSDTNIATVNNTGLVTAVGIGNATITVTTVDGGKTDTFNLSITAAIIGFDFNNLSGYADSNHVTFDQTVNYAGYDYSDFVHPSVLYFEEGWNGHNYWMGVNPYASTAGSTENPFLFYSDDGDNWYTPVGLSQPIYPKEADVGNNSDSHIFMDYDGITMHYLNRGALTAGGSMTEVFSTTDGVTFTPRQRIFSSPEYPDYVSPCVCKVDGKYYMFAIDVTDTFHICVLEATDVRGTWTEINRISNGALGELWHLEVQYLNQEFIVIANNKSASGNLISGGNLMLGKFFDVMDTQVVGRSSALITPPTPAYEMVNGTSRQWNAAIYKCSFVMKSQDEFEVFVGFKGSGVSGSTTPWRVSRVVCSRLPQTLDISDYTLHQSYADVTSFPAVNSGKMMEMDYSLYAFDFTLKTLTNFRPVAFADSTNQHFNFYIEDSNLYVELWGVAGGSIPKKKVSYGLAVNDRITMILDNRAELFVNGRLIFQSEEDVVDGFTKRGAQFGTLNTVDAISDINIYKKPQYLYSAANAEAYKTDALDRYSSNTENFVLVDEFNRANGSIGISDNAVTYEIVGSPVIENNSLKPNGVDTNAILVPYTGDYSVLFKLTTALSQRFGFYLKYTDTNNFIKITLPEPSWYPKRLDVVTRKAGVETITSISTFGKLKDNDYRNCRIDVISNVAHLYINSVHMGSITIPNETFNGKIGFTGGLGTTQYDYAIIEKLV